MEKLSVAMVQADLTWENPQANRARLEKMFDSMKDRADLVILPEMFSTGFSMSSHTLAETMSGPTVDWMHENAVRLDAVITGSIIIRENDAYFNRLLWMRPDGTMDVYDKRHLFRMGNEHEHYDQGKTRLVVRLRGWHICPLICYDLRFPVWSRNRGDVDMLIYVANWPASRQKVWNTLLKARAIENQVFVAGVNRVGHDGEGIDYQGDTQLVNPRGDVVAGPVPNYPGITIADLFPGELTEFRKKFPVGDDADDFTVHV